MRKSECGMRNFKDKKFLINHAKLSLVLTIRYLCFELRAVNSIFFIQTDPLIVLTFSQPSAIPHQSVQKISNVLVNQRASHPD